MIYNFKSPRLKSRLKHWHKSYRRAGFCLVLRSTLIDKNIDNPSGISNWGPMGRKFWT